jgi:hypothetical protein
MRVRLCNVWCLGLLLFAPGSWAQQAASPQSPTIPVKDLPKVSIWEPYSFRLQASGAIEPYRWRLIGGSLPEGINLDPSGELTGTTEETGQFEFTVLVTDSGRPQQRLQETFMLSVEIPLTAEWGRRPTVNGQRIDGSIKVSNNTGHDFDLTFIVLAVNEIGRATAIGYQHFPLKRDTRNMEIPFGDTLSRGNYAVNVDVVGEEPVSNRIFRVRSVAENQQITQGP